MPAPPQEMLRQAMRAGEVGLDFVEISDHFHPWFDSQGHSGFAWSMLAAAAMRTERIGLATGVTCPFIRYHPAVMAQAAATAFITEDDMRGVFGVGPEASAHLAVAQQFVDAGYDHLALVKAGPNPEGFFDFFASELADPLRKLTPAS